MSFARGVSHLQAANNQLCWQFQIQSMGDGARLEMEQGRYLPPTKFAPCNQPYRTPASTGKVSWNACSSQDPTHQGLLYNAFPVFGVSAVS